MNGALNSGAGWLKGNAVSDTHALNLRNGSLLTIVSANVTLLGSAGAIKFLFTDTTHAAWPTAGNVVNDTDGSFVINEVGT